MNGTLQADLDQNLHTAFTYIKANRHKEAAEILAQIENAVASFCTHASFTFNLGLLHQQLGNIQQAIVYFQRSAMLDPRKIKVWQALANAYFYSHDIPSAFASCLRACALAPRDSMLHSNLGYLLCKFGKYEEAIVAFNKALALNPSHHKARCNRYHTLLKLGEYTTGFPEMEYRRQNPKYRHFFRFTNHLPRWQGENFTGKRLLVHHEQGFGDSIMMIRYLPQIKARGGTVILSVEKPLLRLFSPLPTDELIEYTESALSQANADLTVSLMSLPAIFHTTPETIPAVIPYLSPDPKLLQSWKQRLGPNTLHIGLAWAANPQHCEEGVDNRSCGLTALTPLAKLTNTTFYSLQKDSAGLEAKQPPPGMQLFDFSKSISDFADTAALIANLDLIITVDTAVAHLAGALGKPVWVLLPFDHTWRWLAGRSDSPWYPTAKVFHQSYPNDWNSIINNMVDLIQSSKNHEGI